MEYNIGDYTGKKYCKKTISGVKAEVKFFVAGECYGYFYISKNHINIYGIRGYMSFYLNDQKHNEFKLDDYFYTKQEVRKIKLEKLNKI